MTSPNENEKEKILDEIYQIKEKIYDARAYINSEYCRRCSEMYDQIFRLENELKALQRKLDKYECD